MPSDVDGGNIRPLFANPAKGIVKRPLDSLIFHHPSKLMSAIRQDDHKLFVIWDKSGKIKSRALHNVQSDPAEKQNLSASDPRLADKLQKILIDYLAKVDPERPTKKEK